MNTSAKHPTGHEPHNRPRQPPTGPLTDGIGRRAQDIRLWQAATDQKLDLFIAEQRKTNETHVPLLSELVGRRAEELHSRGEPRRACHRG